MRLTALIASLMLFTGGHAAAQSAQPVSVSPKAPEWGAVGRLNMSGRSMCTGALIAPDLVLTAAHCMYDIKTGRAVKPRKIRFDAGLTSNGAKASRRVSRVIVHDDYVHGAGGQSHLGHDLAVVVLERPIQRAQVAPLVTSKRPEKGDTVFIISYTQFSQTDQIMANPCQVMARRGETVVTSCKVDFGASGSPVFMLEGGDLPRVVSVLSSKADMGRDDVSVATTLERALQTLIIRAGQGA